MSHILKGPKHIFLKLIKGQNPNLNIISHHNSRILINLNKIILNYHITLGLFILLLKIMNTLLRYILEEIFVDIVVGGLLEMFYYLFWEDREKFFKYVGICVYVLK